MDLAPITLFVYKRVEHARKTIESLKSNFLAKDSELYIFSDDAENEDTQHQVNQVREYIKTIDGFKKIIIIEREQNLGLANSIISGVTDIINNHGKIIVLEDDMITSLYFLKYMNDALEFYKDNDNVISIHGYIYPVKKELPETYFIKGADCWGWATWKRGWKLFNPDSNALLEQIQNKKLTKKFDINGAFPYTQMLKDQAEGRGKSWAIRWYASAFLADKLTLYPGTSLVQNIGFDQSGTNCGESDLYGINLAEKEISIKKISIKENKFALKQIEKYFKSMHKNPSFWELRVIRFKRAVKRVKKFLGIITENE